MRITHELNNPPEHLGIHTVETAISIQNRNAAPVHQVLSLGGNMVTPHSGRKMGRVPDEMVALAHDVIHSHYCQPEHLSKRALYKLFQTACIKKQWFPCCETTFRKILRNQWMVPHAGKESNSTELKRLCALNGCRLRFRPLSRAGFVSLIEQTFGVLPAKDGAIESTCECTPRPALAIDLLGSPLA